MASCITCGAEIHPERALKYDYCMAEDCAEKNFRGLLMAAIGMNKSADEIVILDDDAEADLASGKYRDQRRGAALAATFPPEESPAEAARPRARPTPATRPRPPKRQVRAPRKPWTDSQERLALLYNEQGLRPAEIAGKLRISPHLVTQIILASRNKAKS